MNFDRVECFGNKISVRIPQVWVEGDEDDDGTQVFYDPNGDSGTLRVSLFTVKRDKQFTPELLQEEDFDSNKEVGAKFFRRDDIVFTQWDEADKENDVHMFWWSASAVVSAKVTRKAMLSYAVPFVLQRRSDFQDHYKMVRDCVFAIHFSAETAN